MCSFFWQKLSTKQKYTATSDMLCNLKIARSSRKFSLEIALTTLASFYQRFSWPWLSRPAVTCLQFPIQVCFRHSALTGFLNFTSIFQSINCIFIPWSWTMTYDLHLDWMKVNHHAKYLGKKFNTHSTDLLLFLKHVVISDYSGDRDGWARSWILVGF